MSGTTGRFARVAPPLPVEGLFTYAVPQALADRVVPGVRVQVPFGRQKLTAMVVAVDDQAPPPGVKAKALVSLVEDEPLVGPDILELASWLSTQLGCSVGEALDATLPRAVKTGRVARTVELVELAVDPEAVPALVDELQARRPQQARTLRILADRGGSLPSRELQQMAHVSRSPLDSLVKAGHLRKRRVPARSDDLTAGLVPRRAPHALTPGQQAVFDPLVEAVDEERARAFLLHGVTGSGKTEIYLQVLDRVVAQGRQGIVLVPEISLTPQTVRRFRERFDRVAILHSHLTEAERHDQWRRIRRGEADVVVGARSAIFAPVPRLGLVILDEEHETTFKQQNVPRYHARETALERARLCGAVTILGTATPSLEALHMAEAGRIERLVLDERVAGGRQPDVMLVDLGVERRRKGYTFLSDALRSAMDDALGREGQIILFLNRRGWAPVLMCGGCRAPLACTDCDVSLTWHRRIGRLMCHYCGQERPPPTTCTACGHKLHPLGFGTEKVEDEVRRSFPGVRVARMDSDTMTGRGDHERVLSAFAEGELDVLVGTQMIAKGLDFPNALLVGVLCADSALFLPDFRAAERTFQLLAQVTGRTGRGPKGGKVVVQAYQPRHPAIRMGVAQDSSAFARWELPQRAELGYPPFSRLVRVVVQGEDMSAVQERARALGELLHDLADTLRQGRSVLQLPFTRSVGRGDHTEAHVESLFDEPVAGSGAEEQEGLVTRPARSARGPERLASPAADHRPAGGAAPTDGGADTVPPLVVLGPSPAPIPRIHKQHRVHLVGKCLGDEPVATLLDTLRGQAQVSRGVRVLIDVDPISLL